MPARPRQPADNVEASTLARHLPGTEASSLPSPRHPRSGFFHRGRNSDFALHRGRNSDFGILAEKPITGPAPKVCQRCDPRRTADRVCFFTITRFAVNPALATGLLHSILRWQHTGHRLAPFNPVLCAGLPWCLLENSGSAPLYSGIPTSLFCPKNLSPG